MQQKRTTMETHERDRLHKVEEKTAATAETVASVSAKVDHIAISLDQLVSKDRFAPVAYIAYGLAGGVLMTFLGAVIGLVLVK